MAHSLATVALTVQQLQTHLERERERERERESVVSIKTYAHIKSVCVYILKESHIMYVIKRERECVCTMYILYLSTLPGRFSTRQ